MLERINWDTDEYRTDRDPREVMRLQRAARDRDVHSLYGVGPEAGRLAVFGTPSRFGSDGMPNAYEMKTLSRMPLPGSYAHARELPKDAGEGYRHWAVQDLDPRELVATQDSVRSDALSHYLSDDYTKKGRLFDNTRDDSNNTPVVVGLMRRKFLLSGHHRATAALLNGEPLQARYRHVS